MHLRFILAVTLIASSLVEAATPPAPQPTPSGDLTLTITESIKKGLEYSPDIKKADGSIKEAEGDLDKARGALFPTINAVGQATAQHPSTTASTASLNPTISSTNNNIYQAGLTLTQPLYAGGGITAGLNYYKTNEAIAKQNYYLAKLTLLGSLLASYYALAQAEMITEAAKSNRDILKAYYDITAHYARIGRSRKMDELQAKANLSLSLVDLEQNTELLVAAQANLNRYIGEPRSTPVKTNFKVVINPIGNITPQEALETAVKNNPTIVGDSLKAELVGYTKDVDLAQDMPSLNFQATGGYQAPDVPDIWDSTSQYYTAGFMLTVPLFSGLTSLSKREIYSAQTYEAEKQTQSDRDTVRVAIESAIDNLRSTQNQLDMAVRAVKEARTALDMANKAYREGTAASTDVINQQTVRYNAEKIFITAQFAYLNALLTLRQQMGIDLEKAYAH